MTNDNDNQIRSQSRFEMNEFFPRQTVYTTGSNPLSVATPLCEATDQPLNTLL